MKEYGLMPFHAEAVLKGHGSTDRRVQGSVTGHDFSRADFATINGGL
jgi:hypothetical protein